MKFKYKGLWVQNKASLSREECESLVDEIAENCCSYLTESAKIQILNNNVVMIENTPYRYLNGYLTSQSTSSLNEEYANNLNYDILDILKSGEIKDKYLKQQEGKLNDEGSTVRTKCSKSSAYNLLKAVNDDSIKDIYLVLGQLSYNKDAKPDSGIISHVWVELDGKPYYTNEPLNTIRVPLKKLKIDKNNDLYSQVENFLNQNSTLKEDINENKKFYEVYLQNKGLTEKEINLLVNDYRMFEPDEEEYDIDDKELIANIRYVTLEELKKQIEYLEEESEEEFCTTSFQRPQELVNICAKILKK